MIPKILERDGFKCQDCGHGLDLHVHHINGKGFGSGDPDNRPENLITVCRKCHGKRHAPKTNIERNRAILIRHQVDGYTFSEIGAEFGISRQRVHQIYQRLRTFLKPHPLTV